jgi:hypothetical protein
MRKLLSLLAFFVVTIMTANAAAQEAGSAASVGLLSIEEPVAGETLTVDEAFSEENGINVPAPFEILIPTSDGEQMEVTPAPAGPEGPFLKVVFTTSDGRIIENIQLIPIALDAGSVDSRLAAVSDLIVNEVWGLVVADYPDSVQDGVRNTIIAGHDAVELVGRYVNPELGLVYTRFVGIPHPDPGNPNGILAIAKISAEVLPLDGPDELPRTRGGVMLENFEFLD